MIHYCTYFDSNYLVRGLTLLRSLRSYSPKFTLWVLCFDKPAFDTVSALRVPDILPIRLSDFEAANPELLAVKSTRSRVEYYFTCSPSLPLYVFDQAPNAGTVIYLDADLLFYSSPQPILDALGDHSILIVPHGFPVELRHLEMFGIYNVGLLGFRNDPSGRRCLVRWREQCLEWCYDRVEDGRFADQRYLDDWPSTQDGVVVLDRPSVGLAPWNFMRYRVEVDGVPPTVNDEPLVFYHYQGFKSVGPGVYSLGLAAYGPMPERLRRSLYGGYLRELDATSRWLRSSIRDAPATSSSLRFPRPSLRSIVSGIARRQMMVSIGRLRF